MVADRAGDSEARMFGSVMGNSVGFPQSGMLRPAAKLAGWAGPQGALGARPGQPRSRVLKPSRAKPAISATTISIQIWPSKPRK